MQETQVESHEILLQAGRVVRDLADASSTVKQSNAFASRSIAANNYTHLSHVQLLDDARKALW